MGASPIALVRSVFLPPIAAVLERKRLPYESLFEAVRLPVPIIERPDDLILLGQVCTLLETVAHKKGIEDIGLLSANTIKFGSFGRFGTLASDGGTLFEWLDLYTSRIAAISTAERLVLNWQDERLYLSHKFALRPFPGMRYADAYALVIMIKAVREVLGPEWTPDPIVLPEGERVRKKQYEAFFKTNFFFKDDVWAISVPPSRLADPVPAIAPKLAEGELPPPTSSDMIKSLGEMIRPGLRLAYPDIGYAARLSGVSVSTLKRRLQEAGLTYSELVETERLRLSIELLAQDGVTIADIASELGYTEPGNFTRAFRTWTGLTPSKFRAANPTHRPSNKT